MDGDFFFGFLCGAATLFVIMLVAGCSMDMGRDNTLSEICRSEGYALYNSKMKQCQRETGSGTILSPLPYASAR